MTQASIFDVAPNTVEAPVYKTPKKTRTNKKSLDGDRMAAFFLERPGQLVSALTLEAGYGLRWRTTVSDLRFAPYLMEIKNHQVPYVTHDGRHKRKSFYEYVPD